MTIVNLPFNLPDENKMRDIYEGIVGGKGKVINNLELFKSWLKCEQHLPENVDKTLLENFLICCKGNLEKAKDKFEKYLVVRTKFKMLYGNPIRRNDFFPYMRHRACYINPDLTSEGYRVMVLRLYGPDATYWNCYEFFQYFSLVFDLILSKDTNAGVIFVYDAGNLNVQYMSKFNLLFFKNVVDVYYNILPFRIKQVHIINVNACMEILIGIIKAFMSEKLRNRLIIHKETDKLEDHIARKHLPEEYGGVGGSFDKAGDDLMESILASPNWCTTITNLKLAGPVPQNRKTTYSFDDYDMIGTFRQLEVD